MAVGRYRFLAQGAGGQAGIADFSADETPVSVSDPFGTTFETRAVARDALKLLDVDEAGFDKMDRALLLTIIDKFAGGPVGIETLAAAVGEERDTESFLPWAREPWACVVLNLHVDHDQNGLAAARDRFRLLIDVAERRGGSYFLTYHRWAVRQQVLAGHPRLPQMLRLKRRWDPQERFQSDWYRHMRAMLA